MGLLFYLWSKIAANNAAADAQINWAEGQAPSSVNDSARAMMASIAGFRDDNNGSLTTGGTSTAYTLTSNQVFDSLAHMSGQTLAFTMSATSGVTPTLNVDGLGAKVIRFATGVALPTGALLSGSVHCATYNNSSSEWLIHNQSSVVPTDSVITASIFADAVTYAKIQNVSATSRLLGRTTAGAGDIEEISLGAGVEFSSTTLKAVSVVPTIQRFLSGTAATYTTPANVKWIRIRMVGGGGGGGEGGNTGTSTSGTASTFSGGTLSAGGGIGLVSNGTNGGAGGTPSNGNVLSIPGGAGGGSNGATNGNAGNGGNSYLGGGGNGGAGGTQNGSGGATNTGGGGGGGSLSGSSAAGGGAGAYIEHIISSPAATYTYTVGGGGAGVSGGGAGGGDGGAGAAGIIIVEEYY